MRIRTTLTRSCGAIAAVAVVAAGAWFASDAAAAGKGKTRVYEIAVTNLTRGQVMSPPFVLAHTDDMTALWQAGQPASAGLAAIAEDADVSVLTDALTGADGVLAMANGAGPIPPGMTGTITVEVRGNRNFVSLAAMLVQTNDAFIGARSIALPKGRGESRATTLLEPAYDAGSEANNEDGAFIPGPPFGNGGVRATEGAEGFVHVHSGVHGIADLAPETYDWRNPTAKIRVTRVE
jgi:spondin N